jgi:CSLREA domain-containing protein
VLIVRLFSETSQATTITVDTVADTSGGAMCSLRDAITAANTDAVAGGCVAGDPGADTIQISVSGTISLIDFLPAVTGDLDIQGPGGKPHGGRSRAFPDSTGDERHRHD